MIRTAIALILSLLLLAGNSAAEPLFAVAVTDTPVLSTPDFGAVFGGSDGNTLRKDNCGQLRSLEFIALPGTVFSIDAELLRKGQKIYRVKTADYPYPSKEGYFIDARFVKIEKTRPPKRVAPLPAREEIITALRKIEGSSYVWGGNKLAGVAELPLWYPPAEQARLSQADKNLWKLAGVDCSGLLYETTGGYTPRNTSALTNFGTGVHVAGKNLKEIAAALEPLDLLVWPGHMLIVIDRGDIIESHLVCGEPDKGVRIRPISAALHDIVKRRQPADSIKNSGTEFVVRRWHGI